MSVKCQIRVFLVSSALAFGDAVWYLLAAVAAEVQNLNQRHRQTKKDRRYFFIFM